MEIFIFIGIFATIGVIGWGIWLDGICGVSAYRKEIYKMISEEKKESSIKQKRL